MECDGTCPCGGWVFLLLSWCRLLRVCWACLTSVSNNHHSIPWSVCERSCNRSFSQPSHSHITKRIHDLYTDWWCCNWPGSVFHHAQASFSYQGWKGQNKMAPVRSRQPVYQNWHLERARWGTTLCYSNCCNRNWCSWTGSRVAWYKLTKVKLFWVKWVNSRSVEPTSGMPHHVENFCKISLAYYHRPEIMKSHTCFCPVLIQQIEQGQVEWLQ